MLNCSFTVKMLNSIDFKPTANTLHCSSCSIIPVEADTHLSNVKGVHEDDLAISRALHASPDALREVVDRQLVQDLELLLGDPPDLPLAEPCIITDRRIS